MRDHISRRNFLETLAWTAGSAAALPWTSASASREKASVAELVIAKGQMMPALDMALQALGGIERFVKPGQKVVIKPNMSFSSAPESGANTHTLLVAEVARRCAKAGAAEILVCDNPLRRPSACLEASGIENALKDIPRTRFVFFTEKKFYQEVDIPQGEILKSISVLKPLIDSHVLINMPVAKTHGSATVTMSLKNLMGLIWERKLFHIRYNLHQAIADLASLIRPDLNILDAHSAMVHGGPGGPGKLEYPNAIVAGTNHLEVDALGVTLAKWYGKDMTARDIPHLFDAYRLGLGEINPDNINHIKLKI